MDGRAVRSMNGWREALLNEGMKRVNGWMCGQTDV